MKKIQLKINYMKSTCNIGSNILYILSKNIIVGISSINIDILAKKLFLIYKGNSACLNFPGFKNKFDRYICISINHEVVHGRGSAKKIIKKNDLISLDICVKYNNYIGDNAKSLIIVYPYKRTLNKEAQYLLKITYKALYKGIRKAMLNQKTIYISKAIQAYIEKRRLKIIKEMGGHGVGRYLHEEPLIPNYYVSEEKRKKLKYGQTIAIEPMVSIGNSKIKFLEDGWTVVTQNNKLSAHFEHTILINKKITEILTQLKF